MERMLERCCALDVHKNQVTACVHVPDRDGNRSELRAQFSTMTAELLGLRDWIKGLGVTHVALQAELGEGNNDPAARSELAKGKLRAQLPALRQALEGRFRAHHAMLVSHLLAHIDYLDETIGSLSAEIEERLRPFERELELLCTIPGVGRITAEVMLAELGPDMSRFPSDRHAASWAAICPGHDESAGKRRSGKTRKGNRWLRTALIEAANSASGRTRGTYLNAQYLRLRSRRGHAKAIVAVAHSILVSPTTCSSETSPMKSSGVTTSLAALTPDICPAAPFLSAT